MIIRLFYLFLTMAAANHCNRIFGYASGFNLTQAKTFVATINNSLPNLGNPTSDFNYGPWGTYLAVSPLSGFKTSFYEGGVKSPLIIKEPQPVSSSASTTSANLVKSFVYVTDITPTILPWQTFHILRLIKDMMFMQ